MTKVVILEMDTPVEELLSEPARFSQQRIVFGSKFPILLKFVFPEIIVFSISVKNQNASENLEIFKW